MIRSDDSTPCASCASTERSDPDRTSDDVAGDLRAGLAEAFGVTGVDRDIDGRGARLAVPCRLPAREDPLPALQDRGHLVGPQSGPAAVVHARGIGEGHCRDHPAGTRGADNPARVQNVRENPARPAQRAGKGIGDGAEDEAPGRELREIGDHRRDQITEVELAGLHEVTDGILRALKRADQRAADIPADVARLGGEVGEGCGDGLPASEGRVRAFGRRSSGVPRGTSRAIGGSSGVVQPGSQGIGRSSCIGQRCLGFGPRAGHGILQRLPAGERPTGGISQHPGRLAIAIGPGAGIVGHRAEAKIRRLEVGPRQRGREGIRRRSPCGRCRALEGIADAPQFHRVEDADAHASFACRPFRQQRKGRVQRFDEAIDPRDDAVQHRLDAGDQPVRGLKCEVADGPGQTAPDRHRGVIGALEDRGCPVAESDDACDGTFQGR